MMSHIYLDELECPHCDYEYYNECWDVEVGENKRYVTEVTCLGCERKFFVKTDLDVTISKEE